MTARQLLTPAARERLERTPVTGTRYKALRALDACETVDAAAAKCRAEAEVWADSATTFGERNRVSRHSTMKEAMNVVVERVRADVDADNDPEQEVDR